MFLRSDPFDTALTLARPEEINKRTLAMVSVRFIFYAVVNT